MTGFGRAEAEFSSKKIAVEIKSLNSKQADVFTHLPTLYKEKEAEIRNLLLVLQRGKIDLAVTLDSGEQAAAATINAALFENYKKQLEAIALRCNMPEPADYYSVIMRMPEVLHSEQAEVTDEEWAALTACVETAVSRLAEFRAHEGEGLQKFFTERLDTIEQLLVNDVPLHEGKRVEKIKARLMESLRELETGVAYDDNRLEQELIFYIEKLDISEEKQRLAKHIAYFRSTMNDEPGQGKKLGFIAQEMGREINTLGSKANNAELQIVVVKMKDELEKIKEQVLNVL